MRFRFDTVVMIGFALWSVYALAAQPPAADQSKPLLDAMTAMQASMQALRPTLDIGDATINGPAFDPVSHEWQFEATSLRDSKSSTVVISLNELSGVVCARTLASDQCVAQGTAGGALKQAHDRRVALDEAVAHPAPDLQGLMVAVIRYQFATKGGYVRANRPLYVQLNWSEGRPSVDLSGDAMRSLADTGVALFPGSAWKATESRFNAGDTTVMNVGLPTRRSDGNFDVRYGFYCGMLCAASYSAVMRHDASGWHVVSSKMTSVS